MWEACEKRIFVKIKGEPYSIAFNDGVRHYSGDIERRPMINPDDLPDFVQGEEARVGVLNTMAVRGQQRLNCTVLTPTTE